PDGKVSLPGFSDGTDQSRFSGGPENALLEGVDLDWGVTVGVVKGSAIPTGALATIHFDDCVGAQPPTTGEFTCKVTDASSEDGNSISGLTCAVALAP